MFKVGTKNRWSWDGTVELGVTFCTWALLVDGLRVPPFDRHPQGDGSLQKAGLEPESWRRWLHAVITRHDATMHRPIDNMDEWAANLAFVYNPTTAWNGSPRVGERLVELWQQYEPQANEWAKRNADKLPPRQKPKEMRKLWKYLTPYQKLLPTLSVYFVDYPEVVSYVFPPIYLVLGSGNGTLDSVSYSTRVLRAAAELASPT